LYSSGYDGTNMTPGMTMLEDGLPLHLRRVGRCLNSRQGYGFNINS
jgi:hypothetical protein